MAKAVTEISEHCRETMISDGSCGVRELISWVQSYMVSGNVWSQPAIQYSPLHPVILKTGQKSSLPVWKENLPHKKEVNQYMNDITEQEMTRYFSNNLRLAEKWAHTAHLSATAGKPTPCGSGTDCKI